MAKWPFGRNKKETPVESTESVSDAVDTQDTQQVEESDTAVVHDATEHGPFDGDSVDITTFDFSDFSLGVLNLGSLQIPLPKNSEVQVEMGAQGPKMLHILTPFGRITPVAFAAPQSAGQWREATKEIAESMRNDGLTVHIDSGPWGREVIGSTDDGGGIVRIIGVDGPRWMLRMTVAAPIATAEQMAQIAREVIARTFVYRGNEPILAGSPLPVTLPGPLAEQVRIEAEKRAQAEQNNQ
ncbi:Protein of uncharacterised function (DUF3710) [Corynebacterium kutscheri]|uniref:Protein of uncharacterized function (DUF3710) n=1 Tax=Corynebacterium kutscheri TaxID=35755 RepID=A0A0F6QZW3_9CORY|nr:DUF3710 domain-containing protein [Corynebacterium kutscheri]AKE41367.1 Protein of unknown function (DUF3710) [Corynebacterium kutscheri]VEH08644.1 Protein of uncharacterised function (DUF3710) [Corynebacterium kutscheri]VEH09691.1 Protein of uncharacterised function (DUF3710) [Corynebacterium kutscheri]VEH79773.1 Protein of uncharacterised function (DUF3710) [Corynebacterium kutscheri]